MNLEHLKNGDELRIKGKEYEVLYSQEEADIVKPPYKKIRTFIEVYLHEIGSKSLHPTHVLWHYPDTKEIFFSAIGLRQDNTELNPNDIESASTKTPP